MCLVFCRWYWAITHSTISTETQCTLQNFICSILETHYVTYTYFSMVRNASTYCWSTGCIGSTFWIGWRYVHRFHIHLPIITHCSQYSTELVQWNPACLMDIPQQQTPTISQTILRVPTVFKTIQYLGNPWTADTPLLLGPYNWQFCRRNCTRIVLMTPI